MKGSKKNWRITGTKRFVGRTQELEQMKEWLNDKAASFKIFCISGMGGIGKSTLMSEMQRISKERNIIEIWIDGNCCNQTPSGFLEYMSVPFNLDYSYGNQFLNPLDLLMKANSEQRILLCIDNFDSLILLESWLMEIFIPKFVKPGIAIILTSRKELSLAWKMNMVLSDYIVELPLAPLSFEETIEFINSTASLPQTLATEVAGISYGYPLALDSIVEAHIKNNRESLKEWSSLPQKISAIILQELDSTELQSMIEILTVLQPVNQETLSCMLENPVTLKQYQMLQELSFIQTESEGLMLNNHARIYLLWDFSLREPKRLNTLRVKAATILYQQLQTVKQVKRKKIILQLLWLCKDKLPMLASISECDTSFANADILELDLQDNTIENWITSIIDENLLQTQSNSLRDLTEKDVRRILSNLHAPAKLQEFVDLFSGKKSGLEVQKHIVYLLTSEKSGLLKQDRHLLYQTYYVNPNNRIAAKQACNMSRASFYRHLRSAILNLTEHLKSQV